MELVLRVAARVGNTPLTKLALLTNDTEPEEDDHRGRNENGGKQKTGATHPPSVIRGIHRRILGRRRRSLLS
jgi:hypothetical protein